MATVTMILRIRLSHPPERTSRRIAQLIAHGWVVRRLKDLPWVGVGCIRIVAIKNTQQP